MFFVDEMVIFGVVVLFCLVVEFLKFYCSMCVFGSKVDWLYCIFDYYDKELVVYDWILFYIVILNVLC